MCIIKYDYLLLGNNFQFYRKIDREKKSSYCFQNKNYWLILSVPIDEKFDKDSMNEKKCWMALLIRFCSRSEFPPKKGNILIERKPIQSVIQSHMHLYKSSICFDRISTLPKPPTIPINGNRMMKEEYKKMFSGSFRFLKPTCK